MAKTSSKKRKSDTVPSSNDNNSATSSIMGNLSEPEDKKSKQVDD